MRPRTLLVTALVVVAFLVRLVMVLRGAGLDGLLGYDDGVYYAGSSALLAGRRPYADFTLLHPPGILVVLLPFAALGRVTSDHVGLAAARTAFMALGAVDAGLVAVVAGRVARPVRQFSVVGAATAGLFYALWYPSIYATRTTLLEGVGSAALLAALALLWRRGTLSTAALVAGGAALGLGAATKIWGVVAVAVVVVWAARQHGWRAAGTVSAGAAAAAALCCAPFFALAPGPMWRMVVSDQLRRTHSTTSPVRRALDASSLSWVLPGHRALATVLLAVLAAAVVALAVVVWRADRARLPVALLVAHAFVLLLSPSYFTHYGELVAAPLAVVLGAAAGGWAQRSRARPGPAQRWAPVVPLLLVLLLEIPAVVKPLGRPVDRTPLTAAVSSVRCVASDHPALLAITDSLTRALDDGCPVPVDLTGATYDVDRETRPDGRAVPRPLNQRWQRDLQQYLFTAGAQVLADPPSTILDPAGRRRLASLPVVARSGPVRVHRR